MAPTSRLASIKSFYSYSTVQGNYTNFMHKIINWENFPCILSLFSFSLGSFQPYVRFTNMHSKLLFCLEQKFHSFINIFYLTLICRRVFFLFQICLNFPQPSCYFEYFAQRWFPAGFNITGHFILEPKLRWKIVLKENNF